jgi:hypothetical protein
VLEEKLTIIAFKKSKQLKVLEYNSRSIGCYQHLSLIIFTSLFFVKKAKNG